MAEVDTSYRPTCAERAIELGPVAFVMGAEEVRIRMRFWFGQPRFRGNAFAYRAIGNLILRSASDLPRHPQDELENVAITLYYWWDLPWLFCNRTMLLEDVDRLLEAQ